MFEGKLPRFGAGQNVDDDVGMPVYPGLQPWVFADDIDVYNDVDFPLGRDG